MSIANLRYPHPNSEDGIPDSLEYAADTWSVQPIHLRYLMDLRACVAADGSRPDVVADLDDRICELKLYRPYEASMTEAAANAICEARRGGKWGHSPEAVINELCCPDRMIDLVTDALEWNYSKSVSREAADSWLTYFRQMYH